MYERYGVPGPDHVLFQAAFANFNPHAASTVDFHNERRASLLLIAGEKDHIAPPAGVKANLKLYQKTGAVTQYMEFSEGTQYILGQDGWREVADDALQWAEAHARDASVAAA